MDNGGVSFAAERLIDWRTAGVVGDRAAGSGSALSSLERARLFEDFAEVVPQAEAIVQDFTGLAPGRYRSRAWVMSRHQWLEANLGTFQRVLEPFALKVIAARREGPMAPVRRHVLGAQVGALLGYLGHRVLGQYDVFLPPDDDGLLYFVGPNIIGLERKFSFPPRQFRLWLSLHEVGHSLQFGGSPWLRGYLSGVVESYLNSVELDPRWLLDRLKHALEEVRRGQNEHRGFGWFFLLMSEDQRAMVRSMQALMSLLEGHSTYVMNSVAREHVRASAAFHRTLRQRRTKVGIERAFQKVIGFDVKVRQYDLGERFVQTVIDRVGMAGFNRVWEGPANLPTMEEIASPEAWVARVGAS
jgi:coenzyme F420 biosynthesis associated uncharacterized protein